MRTYSEMIQFIAVQAEDRLRYFEWPAVIALAEAYGVDQDTVRNDIKVVTELREAARKSARKERHRASNEERRLANLEKKVAV